MKFVITLKDGKLAKELLKKITEGEPLEAACRAAMKASAVQVDLICENEPPAAEIFGFYDPPRAAEIIIEARSKGLDWKQVARLLNENGLVTRRGYRYDFVRARIFLMNHLNGRTAHHMTEKVVRRYDA